MCVAMDTHAQSWQHEPPAGGHILDVALARIRDTSDDHIGRIKSLASLVYDDATAADVHQDREHVVRWVEKIIHSAACLQRSLDHLKLLGTDRIATVPRRTSWRDVLRCVAASVSFHDTGHIDIRNRTSDRPFRQHRDLIVGALAQLVANAAESRAAGARVAVSVNEQWVGRREFVVEISDDGDGIDGARAREIWEPFHTTKRGHIGLGLHYVARVAPIIGTAIDMRSTPGVGTRVALTIKDKGGPEHD